MAPAPVRPLAHSVRRTPTAVQLFPNSKCLVGQQHLSRGGCFDQGQRRRTHLQRRFLHRPLRTVARQPEPGGRRLRGRVRRRRFDGRLRRTARAAGRGPSACAGVPAGELGLAGQAAERGGGPGRGEVRPIRGPGRRVVVRGTGAAVRPRGAQRVGHRAGQGARDDAGTQQCVQADGRAVHGRRRAAHREPDTAQDVPP